MARARRDLPVAQAGKGIEIAVGRSVIALPGVAQHAGHGRAEHKTIQCQRGAGLVKVTHARDLGREHCVEILLRLVHQQGIAGDPGAMEDAVQRTVPGDDSGDQAFNLPGIPKIHAAVVETRPQLRQLAGHRRCAGLCPAAQHDGGARRGVLDRPRENHADAAKAAGHQVDAVRPPRRGAVAQRLMMPGECLAPQCAGFGQIAQPARIGRGGFCRQLPRQLRRIESGGHFDQLADQRRLLQAGAAQQAAKSAMAMRIGFRDHQLDQAGLPGGKQRLERSGQGQGRLLIIVPRQRPAGNPVRLQPLRQVGKSGMAAQDHRQAGHRRRIRCRSRFGIAPLPLAQEPATGGHRFE